MKANVSILVVLLSSTVAQFPFSFAPELSPSVKAAQGIASFISLWEFSLQEDRLSQRLATKTTLAPKTLIVPGDLAMVHLIPQDASHPLYLQDKKHSDLRREFILSHLVLEGISPEEADISTHGVTATTFSGRSVLIRRNKLGKLTVEGVDVVDVLRLADGTQVYRLRQPLFNLRQKVKDAFDVMHGIGSEDEPIGPPLILPESFAGDDHVGARSPAPPPKEQAKPPAAPPQVALRVSDSIAKPPAAPPQVALRVSDSIAKPPAAPPQVTSRVSDSIAKPPAAPPQVALRFSDSLTEGEIFPPAIPPHFKLNARERSIVNGVQPPSA